MDRSNGNAIIQTNNTRSSVPVYANRFWSRFKQSHDYPKGDNRYKRNGYYKYLPAVIALLFAAPVRAETVGGVSATASPIANSSGSVTNQAIQVLQGPYITNTYGGGIQCQGPTVNFTPFVTGSLSQQHPYEPYYMDPVYDMRDLTGDFDANGNPTGDGAPDNPGDILYHVPTRTGQKNNTNLSLGFSMTWSTPLDKKLQDQCKEAAQTQIALQQQLTANKRLDFEIARLKNCGQLLKDGIRFHPRSKYAAICADVIVENKNTIAPHAHPISRPSSSAKSESPVSVRAEDLGAPLGIRSSPSSP
jgi:hypothetical protein